jgi:hypothetical protein
MIYGALMNQSQKLLLSSYPVSTPILLCSPSSSSPGTFQTKKKKKVLIYCQAHSEAFPLLLSGSACFQLRLSKGKIVSNFDICCLG